MPNSNTLEGKFQCGHVLLRIVGHGSYESALLDGGALGWGHEIEVAYGFTDFWKSELALEFKQSVHEE